MRRGITLVALGVALSGPASARRRHPGVTPQGRRKPGASSGRGWRESRPRSMRRDRPGPSRDSTIATADNRKIDLRGTVSIDSTSSPARLDFFLHRDSTAGTLVRRQIYQLAEDTLTVAYALQSSSKAYPRSLDVTKEVVKLKLVKNR